MWEKENLSSLISPGIESSYPQACLLDDCLSDHDIFHSDGLASDIDAPGSKHVGPAKDFHLYILAIDPEGIELLYHSFDRTVDVFEPFKAAAVT